MRNSMGASVPDQAGRASHGAAISVASPPSGDHPSRGSFVERIARAMFDCYQGYNAETQEMMWQQARYGLMRQAERALQAMYDPSPEMIEASNREWDGRMSHRSSGAWQAMIDAALQSERSFRSDENFASGTPTRRAETTSGSVGEADGGPTAESGDAQGTPHD